MTQSYKTPLYYDLIRESGTFDEIEDVQTSEIVLIAYANEDYYLNVPHRFDPDTGLYVEENIAFENTKDFNAWFIVEYDEDNKVVHLKHFNTGKYVSIENGDRLEDDIARLVGEVNDERAEETAVIFEPVNTNSMNVHRYTSQYVFKIRAYNKGKDLEDNYIRFANEDDREKIGNVEGNIFEENENSKIPLVVRDADPINKFDTFKLIFPQDDTYRELIFCKDSTLKLKEIFRNIDAAKEIAEALEKNNRAFYKVFLKIYKFVTNDLEGRTNSDYDVDEIVDYRQEMLAKAGILNLIFDFLDYCIMINKNEDEEWYTELQNIFRISAHENNDFENVIELVFETMYVLFEGNTNNQLAATIKIDTMQQFVFVPNITKVLIVIFKDKQFEMNKKEIHTEVLYRRIYEFDRFQPIVESFIQKLKRTQNSQYIFILRKICLIDGNPLPLIQKEVFNLIYNPAEIGESWDEDQETDFVFGISFKDDILQLTTPNVSEQGDHILDHPDGQRRIVSGVDFTTALSNEEKNFVLDQLALEADLCFGRNKFCNTYFKKRYPVKTLISNITNERIPKTLKAVLVRIFTSLYIDDHPHRLLKMSR